MVFLVVFGHSVETLISENEIIRMLYLSLYSFHMPVFIILSGAVTKLDVTTSCFTKHIKSLIIPLLVFTIIYESLHFLLNDYSISQYTLNGRPYWILWFLLSMLFWKITLPIIMRFRFPLLLSILISLCAGYITDIGYFLGLSRTLYFFPFFILGHKLGISFLSNRFLLKIPKVLYFAVIILNLIVFWFLRDLPHQWLYGTEAYELRGKVEWYTFIYRIFFYFISLVTSFSILMLIPNFKETISARGKNTFFVYIWHGLIIIIAEHFYFSQMLSNHSYTYALVSLFLVSSLVTALLSSNFVAKYTNKLLLEPAQLVFLAKNK